MLEDTIETQTTGPLLDHDTVIRLMGTPSDASKDDDGKPRWTLMPWDALREVVRVLMYGAERYGRNNWVKGMDHTRLTDAAIRHIISWQQGEDCDRESGLHHLAHAACGLLFVVAYSLRGIGKDDR